MVVADDLFDGATDEDGGEHVGVVIAAGDGIDGGGGGAGVAWRPVKR
ncbi:MAG: hypothetical protein U0232_21835 [Thermomicrobiales bacterium]